MTSSIKRILILCKTYPSPSSKYSETSCVAGMLADGALVRLYPVPFRLISDEQQFRKWQWIEARIKRASDDRRKESHRIFVDTIDSSEDPISTADGWKERRSLLAMLPTFDDFGAMEKARINDGITLAILRPGKILGLDIKATASPDWTEVEKAKLLQMQQQGSLFKDAADAATIRQLRKLPHDFHYRYACSTETGDQEYRHKVVDWEAGALYWNVKKSHGDGWEVPFRNKLEKDLPSKDLMFLMGTIHRFPDQWLIVSLLYPPKRPAEEASQGSLF